MEPAMVIRVADKSSIIGLRNHLVFSLVAYLHIRFYGLILDIIVAHDYILLNYNRVTSI
jgi:hypothetical protein